MVHNYDTVTPSTEVHFNYSLLEIGGGEQPQTDHERVPAFSFVLFSHLQLLLSRSSWSFLSLLFHYACIVQIGEFVF